MRGAKVNMLSWAPIPPLVPEQKTTCGTGPVMALVQLLDCALRFPAGAYLLQGPLFFVMNPCLLIAVDAPITLLECEVCDSPQSFQDSSFFFPNVVQSMQQELHKYLSCI